MTAPAIVPQQSWWSDRALLARFVFDLIAGELARLRPGTATLGRAWSDATAIDEDLGADSLEMMQLATALSQALHMGEAGIEDYLLMRRTLGDWVDIAGASLDIASARMSFSTSGSTGTPKTCVHALATLRQEVTELARFFPEAKRLLFAVPSHHIYGFLFTILLPKMLRLDTGSVVDLRGNLPSGLPALARPGDVVIGHPEFWRAAVKSELRYAQDVTGVTSTGPCPTEVCDAVTAGGISRLLQIYGSSETGGIGWRVDPREAYALFPFWSPDADNPMHLKRTGLDGAVVSIALQDRLDWRDQRHFRVASRCDAAVQVGGVNVFPMQVAELLKQHPLVADAAVRLMRPDEGSRLKAFVVLAPAACDVASSVDELQRWIDAMLPVPQRPKAVTIGAAIPMTGAGKPCDWVIAAP